MTPTHLAIVGPDDGDGSIPRLRDPPIRLDHVVERLGKVGEVVTVAPGYARNFLMPRDLALEATEKNLSRIEVDKKPS